jgi:hypothetical protein
MTGLPEALPRPMLPPELAAEVFFRAVGPAETVPPTPVPWSR